MARWTFLIAIVIVAAGCLSVATKYFLSELQLVSGTSYIKKVRRGKIITAAEVNIIQLSQAKAVAIQQQPKIQAASAALFMYLSTKETDPLIKKANALQALQDLESKLLKEPLDPYSWLRKSLAILTLNGDKKEALDAWRNATKLSPFEPRAMQLRLRIGIELFGVMMISDMALLRAQAHRRFDYHGRSLKRYADKNKLTGWVLYLLRDDPEKAEKFLKLH